MGSGPAGGVMGATAVAGAAGVRDFISVDMGGTSYDVCLVRGGEPEVKVGLELAPSLPGRPADGRRASRSAPAAARSRASSRARCRVGTAERGRASRVRSAIGRGGVEPTVTDANLVLGYLNPDRFCGGTMRLDAEGAHAAMRARIAQPLGCRWSRPPRASSGW